MRVPAAVSQLRRCYSVPFLQVSVPPLTENELRELRVYFERLRDVRLAGIQHGVATGGGMAVFENIAGFIDGIALTWSSGKGGGKGSWSAFVGEFFPSTYGDLAGLYDGYRNQTLHNGSAKGVEFTRGAADESLHLTSPRGALVLHLESLARDTEQAFYALNERVFDDAGIAHRVLAWFRDKPPIAGVKGMLSAAGGAQSLSLANAVSVAEVSSATPGPLQKPRPPRLPSSITQRLKRRKRPPKRFGREKRKR
jgi:hypothetical protein